MLVGPKKMRKIAHIMPKEGADDGNARQGTLQSVMQIEAGVTGALRPVGPSGVQGCPDSGRERGGDEARADLGAGLF